MSYADDVFKKMCNDILDNGYSTEGQIVRTKWSDGEVAHTKKIFGVVNRYDLSKEFPMITLRPTFWKSALKELLWIFKDKSCDVNVLENEYGVKYWNAWKREDGTIGKAYGYQAGKEHKYSEGNFDQVDRLIYDLKNNPQSRRMIINLYNHEDLHDMSLYPCAFMTMWNVTGNKLNMTLVQRSSDILAANNINLVQYSLLQHMMAQIAGFEVGEIIHMINDAHIYDRHIPMIAQMLIREGRNAPILKMNKEVKNFYDFTLEDFDVEGYEPHEQITNIPIAL